MGVNIFAEFVVKNNGQISDPESGIRNVDPLTKRHMIKVIVDLIGDAVQWDLKGAILTSHRRIDGIQ